VADRIAPVTGAGGTDDIGLDIIDHARRQVAKDVAGRRRLGRLHDDGGSRRRGQPPVEDGRAGKARAQIRVLVRRILRKYGYPPDKQEKATQTVLEQAKLLCGDWAEGV